MAQVFNDKAFFSTSSTNNNKARIETDKIAYGVDDETAASMFESFNEIYHGTKLTPRYLNSVLNSATDGFAADQASLINLIMDKEPVISAHLETRTLAVLGLDWNIIGGNEAKQKEVKKILNSAGINSLMRHMLNAIPVGYSGAGINWVAGGGSIRDFKYIDSTNWEFDRDGGVWIVTSTGKREPLLDDSAFVFHRHQTKPGIPSTQGLVRTLIWTYFFKKCSERDQARFLERYGMPILTAKISQSDFDNREVKNRYKNELRSLASDGIALITQESELTVTQPTSSGENGNYLNWINKQDDTYALAILGQLASSGEAGGLSKGQTQENVRQDILKADAKNLSETINNQIIAPLEHFKWGDSEHGEDPLKIKIKHLSNEEILNLKTNADIVINLGFTPQKAWVEESFNIPLEDKKETPAVAPLPALASPLIPTLATPQVEGALPVREVAPEEAGALPANPLDLLAALSDTSQKKISLITFADNADELYDKAVDAEINRRNLPSQIKTDLINARPESVAGINVQSYLNDAVARQQLEESTPEEVRAELAKLRDAVSLISKEDIQVRIDEEVKAEEDKAIREEAEAIEMVRALPESEKAIIVNELTKEKTELIKNIFSKVEGVNVAEAKKNIEAIDERLKQLKPEDVEEQPDIETIPSILKVDDEDSAKRLEAIALEAEAYNKIIESPEDLKTNIDDLIKATQVAAAAGDAESKRLLPELEAFKEKVSAAVDVFELDNISKEIINKLPSSKIDPIWTRLDFKIRGINRDLESDILSDSDKQILLNKKTNIESQIDRLQIPSKAQKIILDSLLKLGTAKITQEIISHGKVKNIDDIVNSAIPQILEDTLEDIQRLAIPIKDKHITGWIDRNRSLLIEIIMRDASKIEEVYAPYHSIRELAKEYVTAYLDEQIKGVDESSKKEDVVDRVQGLDKKGRDAFYMFMQKAFENYKNTWREAGKSESVLERAAEAFSIGMENVYTGLFETATGAVKSFINLPTSMVRLQAEKTKKGLETAKRLGVKVTKDGLNVDEGLKEVNFILETLDIEGIGERVSALASTLQKQAEAVQGDSWLEQGLYDALQTLPPMAVSILLNAIPVGGTGASIAFWYTQIEPDIREGLIAKGMDSGRAALIATPTALASAILENIVSKLLTPKAGKRLKDFVRKKLLDKLKDFGKGLTFEQLTEMIQNAVEQSADIIGSAIMDIDIKISDEAKKYIESAYRTLASLLYLQGASNVISSYSAMNIKPSDSVILELGADKVKQIEDFKKSLLSEKLKLELNKENISVGDSFELIKKAVENPDQAITLLSEFDKEQVTEGILPPILTQEEMNDNLRELINTYKDLRNRHDSGAITIEFVEGKDIADTEGTELIGKGSIEKMQDGTVKIQINKDEIRTKEDLIDLFGHEDLVHGLIYGENALNKKEINTLEDIVIRLSKDKDNGFWSDKKENWYREYLPAIQGKKKNEIDAGLTTLPETTDARIEEQIREEMVAAFFGSGQLAKISPKSMLGMFIDNIRIWFKKTFGLDFSFEDARSVVRGIYQQYIDGTRNQFMENILTSDQLLERAVRAEKAGNIEESNKLVEEAGVLEEKAKGLLETKMMIEQHTFTPTQSTSETKQKLFNNPEIQESLRNSERDRLSKAITGIESQEEISGVDKNRLASLKQSRKELPAKTVPVKKILGKVEDVIQIKELTALKEKFKTLARGVREGRKEQRGESTGAIRELTLYLREVKADDKVTASILKKAGSLIASKPETVESRLSDLVADIDRLIEISEHRGALGDLKSASSRLKKIKLSDNLREAVDALLDSLRETKPSLKTKEILSKTKEYFTTPTTSRESMLRELGLEEDTSIGDVSDKELKTAVAQQRKSNMPSYILDKINVIEDKPFSDLEVDELVSLSDALNSIARQQELANTLRDRHFKRNTNKNIIEASDNIKKQKDLNSLSFNNILNRFGIDLDIEKYIPKSEREKSGGFLGWSRRFGITPDGLSFILDGKDDGPIKQNVVNVLRDGATEVKRVIRDAETILSTKKKELEKLAKLRNEKLNFKDWSKKKDILYKDDTGRDIKLTKNERIALYLSLMNKDNARHLINSGFVLSDNLSADPYKIANISSEIINDVESSVYEKGIADIISNTYDGVIRDAINKTSKKLLGFSLAKIDKYFPIITSRMHSKYGQILTDPSSTDIDNITNFLLEVQGFLKERTAGAKNAIILSDAQSTLNNSINQAARYSGYAEPLRKVKAFISGSVKGENLEKTIRQTFGREYWKGLNNLKNIIEDENKPESGLAIEGLTKFADLLMRQQTKGSLFYNTAVAFLQELSYLKTFDYIPLEFWSAGFNSKPADMKEMSKYSPDLYDRFKGSLDIGMNELRNAAKKTPIGAKGMRYFDARAIGKIWNAVKLWVESDMPELAIDSDAYFKEITKRSVDIVHETQPTFDSIDRPEFSRSKNIFAKQLSRFKSQLNKNNTINMKNDLRAYHTINEWINRGVNINKKLQDSNITQEEKTELLKEKSELNKKLGNTLIRWGNNTVLNRVIIPSLVAMIKHGRWAALSTVMVALGIKVSEEEEDIKANINEMIFRVMTTNLADSGPLLSIVGSLLEGWSFEDVTTHPAIETVKSLSRSAMSINRAIKDYNNRDTKEGQYNKTTEHHIAGDPKWHDSLAKALWSSTRTLSRTGIIPGLEGTHNVSDAILFPWAIIKEKEDTSRVDADWVYEYEPVEIKTKKEDLNDMSSLNIDISYNDLLTDEEFSSILDFADAKTTAKGKQIFNINDQIKKLKLQKDRLQVDIEPSLREEPLVVPNTGTLFIVEGSETQSLNKKKLENALRFTMKVGDAAIEAIINASSSTKIVDAYIKAKPISNKQTREIV